MKLEKVSKQKFIAIILARGGSKGIKDKNIISVNKKPLIYWSIKTCLNSELIDSVWVSSDSKKILNLSKKFGAKIILRPKKYSKDNSSSEDAWLHAVKKIEEKFKFEAVVGIQPTSPLRPLKCLDKAITKYKKEKLDSLFSSSEIKECNIWQQVNKKLIANYNFKKRPRRQEFKKRFYENGSFYIFDKRKFLKFKCRLFGKIGFYLMSKIFSFQIDEKEDIELLSNFKRYF